MAAIPTKQLFQEYFDSLDSKVAQRIRGQVDRLEVYEFEEQIGKQLVDMNVDELLEMLKTFKSTKNKNRSTYSLSLSSYSMISSFYRSIFDFYIEHYGIVMLNPWYNKKLKSGSAIRILAQEMPSFNKEILNNIIDKMYTVYGEEEAKYLECILLLFYCGFSEAREIVSFKESDINFRTKEIRVVGRTIKLSDRCFDILVQVHKMSDILQFRTVYSMESWHDSYFKIIIREKNAPSFQDNKIEYVSKIIVNKIGDIKRKLNLDVNFNYRTLYFLGFYDYLTEKIGKEKAKELITAVRNPQATRELLQAVSEYGSLIPMDNVTLLKNNLRPFID